MNYTTTTQSGERLSFFKLFSQKNYRILIPIIQRDYAQGRKTTKVVRDSFLDALFNYLNENKPNRDLDFVYGSLIESDGITDFIPLDGQQRLTTVFLLHWYLCQISDNIEKKNEFKNALLKNEKSLFTYETRSSSKEFCDALMYNDIDFNTLLESDMDSDHIYLDNSLSKTIKNCTWFYLSWKYDPTIQSMLTMLDAIHKKFSNKKEFFERLLDNENPIITFLFLNLKDFKLTDDLYIKMNSRGKPLTPFENFKAKFEQFLETVNLDRKFSMNFDNTENEVSLKEYFSYYIDTKWANLFWHYRTLHRSKNENEDTFDDELMNFIRVIFTNQYALIASSKEKDDTLEYLIGTNVAKKENKDYSDVITFHKYKELNVLFDKEEDQKYYELADEPKDENERILVKNKREKLIKLSTDCVLNLIDAFNCFINGNNKIKVHLSENYKFYFDENIVFENALKHNFETNQQRLCFHAYIIYLISNKNDVSGIEQWLRVIHNLTHPENTIIDNASEVAAAIKSIEELLPHSKNILGYLKSNPNISSFSTWQVLEENIKAHLICKNDAWKNLIEKVEKHRYFNGQIGFLLEFSGILEFYDANKNCDWDNQLDGEYFKKFTTYANKASKVFEENYENRINNKEYIFERAVLTKGDYLTTASQNRKNLLSTNLVKNNIKRDHSWKRLLRLSNDADWTFKRFLVKKVFDDRLFNEDNLEVSLNSICSYWTNTWRDYFIACPGLFSYCKQGFIKFENESNILLYGESQINHMHAELYTYYLWKVFLEHQESSFEPFNHIQYNEVKSIDDKACIVMNDFLYKRINYEALIYYCDSESSPKAYKIVLKKSNADNIQEKYADEIIEILNLCDFEWIEENNGYFCHFTGGDNVIEKIRQLTNYLKKMN